MEQILDLAGVWVGVVVTLVIVSGWVRRWRHRRYQRMKETARAHTVLAARGYVS